MDDVRIEGILRAVECVPRSELATYGDIGKIVGENPRVIGRVMALWGSNVPWWRICNVKGEIAGHFNQALPHWQEENIARNEARTGVKLAAHRTDYAELVRRWQKVTQDLE
ncbi:MAG: MGMT family protein [Rothia sp. (in: high G+C Gram-positive bacteria)]|nr:MGMT family protein [Rothia sp. (in: high G+C Gram-positive bacteria)]